MKNSKLILLSLLFLLISFPGCDDKDDNANKVDEIVVLVEDVLIAVGKSDTILATTYPADKPLEWSSSSPSVVSVNQQGVLTGLSQGTSYVIIKYGDLTDSVFVEVFQPLTDINITPNISTVDLTIEFGIADTLQLTASPVPVISAEPIIWKSSNPSVVSVSPTGFLMTVGPGEATITVSGREGTVSKEIVVNVGQVGETPIQFDSKLFKRAILPGDNYEDRNQWWFIEAIWNGRTDGGGGSSCALPGPQSFTFDMGVTGNLAYYHHYGWESNGEGYPPFSEANVKRFEVWGAEELDLSGSWDSWTKLMDCEVIKPSGLPNFEASAADWAAHKAGFKFYNRDNYNVRVRYIRVKVLETFDGSPCWRIAEIKLFGQPV